MNSDSYNTPTASLEPCSRVQAREGLRLENPSRYSLWHLCCLALSCLMLLSNSACVSFNQEPVETEPPVVEDPEPPKPVYSAAPIKPAPKTLVRFAQTALAELGYKIGRIDGIWGPRSARAIKTFETEREIWSAGGHLSELNLHHLAEASGLTLATFEQANQQPAKKAVKAPRGITAKLNKRVPLSKGAQLIIVERRYQVFAKPNPYSAMLTKLEPGTGIYVVSRDAGWYEIESINRLRGYVRVD